jgi:hypothetical protein
MVFQKRDGLMNEHYDAICMPNAGHAKEDKRKLAKYILIDLKNISKKHKDKNFKQVNDLLEEAIAACDEIAYEQITNLVGPELFRARFIIRWCEDQDFMAKEEINEYMKLFPLMLGIRMAAMGIIRNTYSLKIDMRNNNFRYINHLHKLWQLSGSEQPTESEVLIRRHELVVNGHRLNTMRLCKIAGIPKKYHWNNKGSCISLHEHGVELNKYIKELNNAASQPIHTDQKLSLLENKKEKIHYVNGYLEGEALIKKAAKEFHEEIKAILDGITLLKGGRFVGCSDVWYQGYAFFNPDNQWTSITYADHLIHETAHIRLHAFNELNAVLVNAEEKGKSPIRVDSRPLYGILHSTFVFLRLVLFFQKLAEIQEEEEIMFRLHRHLKGFYEGMQELDSKAQWTDAGKIFFSNMCSIRTRLSQTIGKPQEKYYINIGNDYVL